MRTIIVLLIAAISLTCIPHETVHGSGLTPTLIPPEVIERLLASLGYKDMPFQDLVEFQKHRIQYMRMLGDYDTASVCKFH